MEPICAPTKGSVTFIVVVNVLLATSLALMYAWPVAHCSYQKAFVPKCTPMQRLLVNAAAEWSSGRFVSKLGKQTCTWVPYVNNSCILQQRISCQPPDMKMSGPRAILMFGDSVDRYIIQAACQLLNTTAYDWAKSIIKYKSGISPSGVCASGTLNISFVHLYGSKPRGPYLHGHQNDKADPYTDTPLRIRKTLLHYKKIFNANPEMIIYQTNLWDGYGKLVDDTLDRITSATTMIYAYKMDTLQNIRTIQSMVPKDTPILLRTTPEPSKPAIPLTSEFNNAIRTIGVTNCLPVLDWASMTSYLGKVENIFRDTFHPNHNHSQLFAKALIELSRYIACMRTHSYSKT